MDATRLLHSGTESRDRFRREPAAFPRSRGTCSRRLSGRRQRTATGAPVRIVTTPAGCCRCSPCRASGADFWWDATVQAVPPALFAGKTRPMSLGCHHPLHGLTPFRSGSSLSEHSSLPDRISLLSAALGQKSSVKWNFGLNIKQRPPKTQKSRSSERLDNLIWARKSGPADIRCLAALFFCAAN